MSTLGATFIKWKNKIPDDLPKQGAPCSISTGEVQMLLRMVRKPPRTTLVNDQKRTGTMVTKVTINNTAWSRIQIVQCYKGQVG